MPVKPILEEASLTGRCSGIHQAGTFAKGVRKSKEDVHSRDEPLRESIIGIPVLRNLFCKDCEDRIGRIAGLKGGK